jgi:hypothetical protein
MAWWVIEDVQLQEALKRAHAGEDPEVLYVELYANSDVDQVEPNE